MEHIQTDSACQGKLFLPLCLRARSCVRARACVLVRLSPSLIPSVCFAALSLSGEGHFTRRCIPFSLFIAVICDSS